MVVVFSALVAGLVFGIAAWSLLGLGWPAGIAVLFGLLVVIPLGAVVCLGMIHRLPGRALDGSPRRTYWSRFRP